MGEFRNRLRAAFAVLCGHSVIFGWRLTPDYLEPLRVREHLWSCSMPAGAWIGRRRYHTLKTAMHECEPGDVVKLEAGVYPLSAPVPRGAAITGDTL